MLSRAVLAIGEAGNFPIAIKATAECFPKKERSFATGIFNSGANVGAILAPICVPLIAALWGWEAAFIVIGALGFVWVGAVWIALYEKPEQQKRLSAQELAYIRSDQGAQAVPGTDSGAAAKNYAVVQAADLTAAPGICLRQVHDRWRVVVFPVLAADLSVGAIRHEEGQAIVLPLAVLYSMTMVGSIGGGWFPSYFMARGDAL